MGHHTTISHNKIEKASTNLVIGADWLSEDNAANTFLSLGADYFIYEVEAFTGTSINDRPNFNINNYIDIIAGSLGVLTPYKYNIQTYTEHGLHDNIFYAPWGHYDEIIDLNISRKNSIEWLGIFYGLQKDERAATIRYISDKLKNRVMALDGKSPFMLRSYYTGKTKYVLSISQGANERFVNPFRIQYSMSNGVPVLSNHDEDKDGYLSGTVNVRSEHLVETLIAPPPAYDEVIEASRARKLEDGLRNIL